jgi:phytoene dehydrogenase-like protein
MATVKSIRGDASSAKGERAVADVVTLPTAAADPPPRIRWRGKYPRVVTKLGPIRARRKHEVQLQRAADYRARRTAEEDELAQAEQLRAVFAGLASMANRGAIAGAALVFEQADGHQVVVSTGTLADPSQRLEAARFMLETLQGIR